MSDPERKIPPRLRTAWNRKLYAWWEMYNWQYLDQALRRPVIVLSRSRKELGHWDGARRRLSISARHIERDPWPEVMETLRHEMAHQYVDEVLRPSGETDHGEAFRRACEKLRCGPFAGSEAKAGKKTKEEERLLERIRKLLSLGSSPNEHEAEAAVQKARQLLLRYNIDALHLEGERSFGYRYLGEVKGRHASHELQLARILNDFFFVEVIWVPGYLPLSDREGTVLQVCGTPSNLDMAEYVYEYLTRLLERLWQEYRKRRGLPGNRERQRYYAGVLGGFYQKLLEQDQKARTGQALVWKGDGELRQYFRYLHPAVRKQYRRGASVTAAYRDGVEEGRKVTIHRPVGSSDQGFGGYLESA